MKKERISRVVSSEAREALIQTAVSSEERHRRNSGGASTPTTRLPVAPSATTSRVKIEKVNGALVMKRSTLPNKLAKVPGKRGSAVLVAPNPLHAPSAITISNKKLADILSRKASENDEPKCQRARLQEQIANARHTRELKKQEYLSATRDGLKTNGLDAAASVSSPSVSIEPSKKWCNSLGVHSLPVNKVQNTQSSSNSVSLKPVRQYWYPTANMKSATKPFHNATKVEVNGPIPTRSSNVNQTHTSPDLSNQNQNLPLSGESRGSNTSEVQNLQHFPEPDEIEDFEATEAPDETNEDISSVSINFYGTSEQPSTSATTTDVSSPDLELISAPTLSTIYDRGAKPHQLYFNRNEFVYGEQVRGKYIINFIKIGKKIKKQWKKSEPIPEKQPQASTSVGPIWKKQKLDSESTPISPHIALQTNPSTASTPVLQNCDPLPGKYTVHQIAHVNMPEHSRTPQLKMALDFFLRQIINGLSLTDLQANFDVVIRKLHQFFTPLPTSEEVAEAMLWKLIATHDHPMVMEPIPQAIKAAGQQCRTEPPMPEMHRKIMIAIGKLRESVADYKGLPGKLVVVFKKCFEHERDRMTAGCLVSLGRFFGDLFDKYFPLMASPMNLIYFVMTKRPSATHAFFYGMLCSNPDPFTMSPMPFDYYAVSIRDRCILYAIFHSLQFYLSRYFEPTWIYMKSLGHVPTEMSWDEFSNNLIHEMADANAEQRRNDAAKGLKLIILQAGVTWFHTHFTKQWYILVKDFELQKYRMVALMRDYIMVVSSSCQEFLTNEHDFRLEEVADSHDKLISIQSKIKEFLNNTPEIGKMDCR